MDFRPQNAIAYRENSPKSGRRPAGPCCNRISASPSHGGTKARVVLSARAGCARLEHATAAFRKALKEGNRERAPGDGAGTQASLANALFVLDTRTRHRAARGGCDGLPGGTKGTDCAARSAPNGRRRNWSWQCSCALGRAGKHHRPSRTGGRGLQRSPQGRYAAASAAQLGHMRRQSWHSGSLGGAVQSPQRSVSGRAPFDDGEVIGLVEDGVRKAILLEYF